MEFVRDALPDQHMMHKRSNVLELHVHQTKYMILHSKNVFVHQSPLTGIMFIVSHVLHQNIGMKQSKNVSNAHFMNFMMPINMLVLDVQQKHHSFKMEYVLHAHLEAHMMCQLTHVNLTVSPTNTTITLKENVSALHLSLTSMENIASNAMHLNIMMLQQTHANIVLLVKISIRISIVVFDYLYEGFFMYFFCIKFIKILLEHL